MDIVIYTTPETLEHKKGADGYEEYYWSLSNPPRKLNVGDRIFFAVKGNIVGSFECKEFNPYNEETICWHKDSWKELDKPIPTKHFQGFKYRNW